MKVQPLNQTALQVSWSQPETIYHPPIMNYVISYSWTKNEDEKEKTFTKDSDKDLVRPSCAPGGADGGGRRGAGLPQQLHSLRAAGLLVLSLPDEYEDCIGHVSCDGHWVDRVPDQPELQPDLALASGMSRKS